MRGPFLGIICGTVISIVMIATIFAIVRGALILQERDAAACAQYSQYGWCQHWKANSLKH